MELDSSSRPHQASAVPAAAAAAPLPAQIPLSHPKGCLLHRQMHLPLPLLMLLHQPLVAGSRRLWRRCRHRHPVCCEHQKCLQAHRQLPGLQMQLPFPQRRHLSLPEGCLPLPLHQQPQRLWSPPQQLSLTWLLVRQNPVPLTDPLHHLQQRRCY